MLWVVVLLAASHQIVYYVYQDWVTLRRGPLLISVEDERISVGHVDFPAVTVCPTNFIHRQKLATLQTRVLGNSPSKEVAKRFSATIKALLLTAEPSWNAGYKYLLRRNITPFPVQPDDITPFLHQVTPSLSDMFIQCFWRGTTYPCEDLMRHQITEYGFCFSFNSHTALRTRNDSERNPPFRKDDGTLNGLKTNSEGRTSAFEAFLAPEKITSDGSLLYWISVDNPLTIPQTSTYYPLRVQRNMIHRLEVQVEVNRLQDSIKNMDDDALPCNPNFEETINNCLMGCRLHHVWKFCHCVLYMHAVAYKNESVPICGVHEMQCVAEQSRNLNFVKLDRLVIGQDDSSGMDCNCKPPCNSIDYITKIKVNPRDAAVITTQFSIYIDVFYFSKWALSYVSRTKISWKDLFASLGGTSGFYLGASIISFIEIFVIFLKVVILSFKNTIRKTELIKNKRKQIVKEPQFPFIN